MQAWLCMGWEKPLKGEKNNGFIEYEDRQHITQDRHGYTEHHKCIQQEKNHLSKFAESHLYHKLIKDESCYIHIISYLLHFDSRGMEISTHFQAQQQDQ